MSRRRATIGVFDSGVGGLTVLKEVVAHFPEADYLYFGDTARLPYGAKSAATVGRYAASSARYLEQQGAEQFLGRNRRPPDVRVQPIKTWRQPIEDRICHATDGAQRVVPRHALLGRDVAEHPAGLSVVTAHRHAPFDNVGSIVVRRDHRVDPLEVTFSAPC